MVLYSTVRTFPSTLGHISGSSSLRTSRIGLRQSGTHYPCCDRGEVTLEDLPVITQGHCYELLHHPHAPSEVPADYSGKAKQVATRPAVAQIFIPHPTVAAPAATPRSQSARPRSSAPRSPTSHASAPASPLPRRPEPILYQVSGPPGAVGYG